MFKRVHAGPTDVRVDTDHSIITRSACNTLGHHVNTVTKTDSYQSLF